MTDHLSMQGRQLEDLFFMQQDTLLVQKRRELERMERTQQALFEVSGIANQHTLAKLVELEVTPDLLATLVVVPLVEVAWADGKVAEKERDAILRSAEQNGVNRGAVDYALLDEWLKTKPPAKLLTAWIHYIEGLTATLTPQEREELQSDLMTRARAVAEAAGGFLGIGRISASELRVLEKMEQAFHGKPGRQPQ